MPYVSSTRQAPRTRIQALNEERILDAALDVFAANGFHGATVDMIAAGVGMSKPNVLYYFRRKRDIHRAVLERTLHLWMEPFDAIDPDGDPVEELWRYAKVKLQLSRSSPEASRLFANEVLQGADTLFGFLDGDFRNRFERKCRVIETWIAEGKLAPLAPRHLVFMIWSLTQHYADFYPQVQTLCDGDNDDTIFDDAERTLRQLLTNGLRGQTPAPVE